MNRPKDDIISGLWSSKKCWILSYKSVIRKLEINGSWGLVIPIIQMWGRLAMKEHLDNEFNRCGSGCSASSRHLKYKKVIALSLLRALSSQFAFSLAGWLFFWKITSRMTKSPPSFKLSGSLVWLIWLIGLKFSLYRLLLRKRHKVLLSLKA